MDNDWAPAVAMATTQKRVELVADMASALGHSTPGTAAAIAAYSSAASFRGCRKSSRVSCSTRKDWSLRLTELARNLTGNLRVGSLYGPLRAGSFNRRGSQVVVQGRLGRSALYGDGETYVLMEPGEDEQFVTAEELQEKLKKWLQEWPGEELPLDLTKFKNIDEAVQFLVNAVCELDLGDGQGSLQWYEVRL